MLNELGILELRTFGFFSCFFAVISFIKYLLYFLGSIVYVISAPMSPIFGLLVDKTGKNLIWVLCAVVTTLASHIMLAFTLWNPWIALVMWLLTLRGSGRTVQHVAEAVLGSSDPSAHDSGENNELISVSTG